MIDIAFSFTEDTPNYWETFGDPDWFSPTLRKYQKLLCSRALPNGEQLELVEENGYLSWNGTSFGSDSIIASFRYKRNQKLIDEVKESVEDWDAWLKNYLLSAYTIGGEMLFPRRKNSINQARGINPFIKDRWDLSLECIRRYYENELSPLKDVLEEDKSFFDLFIDFKGFVDFFFLQDCVTSDYKTVNLWLDTELFERNPLPKTVEEYWTYMNNELLFLEKRNERIKCFVQEAKL